ncbi:MAG: S9 family peptidase [Acidobacteria bacterium]|nr:S9 family peptidase [Acidobacteriota bacterium]
MTGRSGAYTVFVLAAAVACARAAAAQTGPAPGEWADAVLSVRSLAGNEAPQWSPDGSRILFVSHLGGPAGLWSIPAGGGFPVGIVPDIGRVPFQMAHHARWSPDGDRIAYVSDKGGPAAPPEAPVPSDIWTWSAAEGRSARLTALGARVGSLAWSPDGKWIAFSGGLRGNYDIWKVAVPTGELHKLTHDPRYELTPVWSPDGRKILYVRADERWVDHDIMEIGADGSSPRVVVQDRDFFDYGTAGTPAFGAPLPSPDGKTVLFRSWRSGWINYWTVPIAGGEPGPLAPEPWDQSAARWAPDGRSVSFVSNRNGTLQLRVAPFPPGDPVEPRMLVAPALGIVANPEWSPDGRSLCYGLATPTRALDLHVTELESGQSRQLTFSMPGGDIERQLAVPQKVVYPGGGLNIHAYLYQPRSIRAGERRAAIVFAHGGPTSQYVDQYEYQMQFFAGQGYVVLAPNFRGSSGYGRAFADLNDKCWAHCDLDDLVAGVQYLKSLPYVDPDRVGITGTSHGGLLSMAGATFAPGVFRAAIAHGGTADRIYYYHTQELRHIKQAESEFGPFEENAETYRYVSPFYFVRQVSTPIFVIWGEGRWPGSQNSKRYAAELERHYKVFRAKAYPGENYYVSGAANTRQMLLDMLEFFDQYLRDGSQP